ncbi:septum site-determining protein MinC [Halopseudomonas salegens]|uniref:Probable septum site-determining protein MinC n=1 Tax=Halopseudomonas salegens TaxID=1434072 RepID=A0A1H2GE73_9GAMM|nr:septum site-determining protein MinC [Halopseudomonas salegens]SDU17870.1 septum site-determining protein MinC [Halopseudomonas salegens]
MTANSTPDLLDNDPVFHLKGGMLAMTMIELIRQTPYAFARQLADKVEQAPNFFRDTPVVFSLEKLSGELAPATLQELLRISRDHGLQAVALRGDERFRQLAQEAELVLLPPGRTREKPLEEPAADAPPVADEPVDQPTADNNSPVVSCGRVITDPIRSGQQVYARGGDLVVLAPVSAGAELLADGHIHVYGPLRGRALAGVRGNTEARIICQSLEAELVSIAGQYKVAEDLRKAHWKKAIQVSLDGDSLKISEL